MTVHALGGFFRYVDNSTLLNVLACGRLLSAALCPRLLPVGLANRDDEVLQKLQKIIQEVGENMGIDPQTSITVRVTALLSSNACCIGSIHSFGGPLILLGASYYRSFTTVDEGFEEWIKFIDELPNDPIEMARYLDQNSDLLMRIEEGLKKYDGRISEKELKGILAHELGHARHSHAWQNLGFRALFTLEYVQPQVSVILKASLLFIDHLLSSEISVANERDADNEANKISEYRDGNRLFFKVLTLKMLLTSSSVQWLFSMMGSAPANFERKAIDALQESTIFPSHPTPIRRLAAISSPPFEKNRVLDPLLMGLGVIYLLYRVSLLLKSRPNGAREV